MNSSKEIDSNRSAVVSDPTTKESIDILVEAGYYFFNIYPPVLTILSLTNLFAFAVLLRQRMRTAHTNVYLSALAMADYVWVNTSTWCTIDEVIKGGNSADNIRYLLKSKLFSWVMRTLSVYTLLMVVVVSFDRLVMIYKPLWSKIHFTVRRAVFVSVILFVAPSVYQLHVFYGIDGVRIRRNDTTTLAESKRAVVTKIINPEYHYFTYMIQSKIIRPLFELLMCSLIILFNLAIIIKLIKRKKSQESNNLGASKTSDTRKITGMLVIMALLTAGLRLPSRLWYITEVNNVFYRPHVYWWEVFFNILWSASFAVGYLNSCVNFFIYVTMSSKFREEFVDMIKELGMKMRCQSSDTAGKISNKHDPKGSTRDPRKQILNSGGQSKQTETTNLSDNQSSKY